MSRLETELLELREFSRRGLLGRLDQKIADVGRVICRGQVGGFPRVVDVGAAQVGSTPGVGILLQVSGAAMAALAMASLNGDAQAGTQLLPATLCGFNGTNFDRFRTNSAAVLSSAQQPFGQLVANPGEWTINNAPAGNTQATASKAAGGAGVRHVLRALTASLVSTAAAASTQNVVVRDGASGAGTVIWTFDIAIPATANSGAILFLSGLNIFGSANTAMTVEFVAAGGVSTLEKVSASGYDTV